MFLPLKSGIPADSSRIPSGIPSEPSRARILAYYITVPVAQWLRRVTTNHEIEGSSPSGDVFGVAGAPLFPSYVHTMVKAPDPFRTLKLSTIGPAQYCGGGPRGNRR